MHDHACSCSGGARARHRPAAAIGYRPPSAATAAWRRPARSPDSGPSHPIISHLIPPSPNHPKSPQHIPTHPRNPKSNFKGHLLLRDGKRISTFAPLHDIPRSPTFRLQQFGLRVRPGRPIVIPAGFNVGGVSAVLRVPGPGWPGMARDRGPRVFWISGHSLALARARGSGHGPGARAPTPPLPPRPIMSDPVRSLCGVEARSRASARWRTTP